MAKTAMIVARTKPELKADAEKVGTIYNRGNKHVSCTDKA